MANWVEGSITPYGNKEKIEAFKKYITEKQEWKMVINRNAPDDLEENEIYIYDNSASHAIQIAEEMEEQFRNVYFHFYVVDCMNDMAWSINYMAGIETTIYSEGIEGEGEDAHLKPIELDAQCVTDEFITKRKEERKKKETWLPF